MYVKRPPLGQGKLTFSAKKRRRYPRILVVIYFLLLGAALVVLLRAKSIQPQVAAMFGPTPQPTISPVELAQLGYTAYMKGEIQQAADFYQQAVAGDPENMEYLFHAGRMLTLTEDPANLEAALAIGDQMVALNPDDPRGHAIRARALDWQDHHDDAVLAALQAIKVDPEYALGYAYLGEAYTDLGRLRQAREQLEVAIALDPYSVDARRNYAYVLEYYGDYGGAIQQYQQALALHPNLLDLLYGLARNYRGAGQTDLSIQTYNEIINRTGGTDPLPHIELGRTYFEMREDASAQEAFQSALALYDEGGVEKDYYYLRTLIRLGQVYFTRRNYESAIETFELALNWAAANDHEQPLEAYIVTASAYYYLDICRDSPADEWESAAVPRAVEAFNLYLERKLDDEVAMKNILSIFVLCRDYVYEGDPYIYQGEGFTNGFPDGYEEPCVEIPKPGSDETTVCNE